MFRIELLKTIKSLKIPRELKTNVQSRGKYLRVSR